MNNINYTKSIQLKILSLINKKAKPNFTLQHLYNSNCSYEELIYALQEYNLSETVPYLASGISCYFNKQVDESGLSNLKLSVQDKEDAKFIASCFGKEINYSDNNLPILYTTLLGTTEFNYATQTFPAGIFEDVFQCPLNHSFPIQPIVGESEPDFYCRILDYHISQCDKFPLERRNDVLYKANRLAVNFCRGKNRIYLIPFDNVLGNKASFGDVAGLRDGKLKNEELKIVLDSLPTFEELLQSFGILSNNGTMAMNPYMDPNMTSEYGIAIYGSILTKGISFFEVDRKYDLIQKKAKEAGYINGEVVPIELASENLNADVGFSK